jgi:hypothetical protein
MVFPSLISFQVLVLIALKKPAKPLISASFSLFLTSKRLSRREIVRLFYPFNKRCKNAVFMMP